MAASNGGTWLTAHSDELVLLLKRRMRSRSSPWRVIARRRRRRSSLAPASISAIASGFMLMAMLLEQRTVAVTATSSARMSRKMPSAPLKSGHASSTSHPSASNVRRCASSTSRHARIERQPAEVGAPCDADALEVAIERRCERRRVGRVARRIARVRPGHHAQQQRDVGDRPRHRPLDGEPGERQRRRRHRHEADRRAEPDDVVEVAGLRSDPPRSLPSAIGSMPGRERRARRRRSIRRRSSSGRTDCASCRRPCCRCASPCRTPARSSCRSESRRRRAAARRARSPPSAMSSL